MIELFSLKNNSYVTTLRFVVLTVFAKPVNIAYYFL